MSYGVTKHIINQRIWDCQVNVHEYKKAKQIMQDYVKFNPEEEIIISKIETLNEQYEIRMVELENYKVMKLFEEFKKEEDEIIDWDGDSHRGKMLHLISYWH